MAKGRPTALGIPSPWSGDEFELAGWRYEAWFWLYRRTRILRHKVGLHDWRSIGVSEAQRCTWCGKYVT